MTYKIEDPRNAEAAISRVQRDMERAERHHHRWLKNAVVGGVIGGAFVVALVATVLAGLGRSSASASVPAPSAEAPEAATADRPAAPAPADTGPAVPDPEAGQGSEEGVTVPPVDTPAPVVEPKPEPAPKPKPQPKPEPDQAANKDTKRLSIRIGGAGYEPSTVTASSDRPISLTVGKGEGCAAGFLMPSLGIDKDNSSGSVTIGLGRLKPGTYGFSCGMGMVQGELVVR